MAENSFVTEVTFNVEQLFCNSEQVSSTARGVLQRKVFLAQNSLENTYVRVSFLITLQVSSLQLYLERLLHKYFPVNFAKFPRTIFFTEHFWTVAS